MTLHITGRADLLATWAALMSDWHRAFRLYDAAGMQAAAERMDRISRALREGGE